MGSQESKAVEQPTQQHQEPINKESNSLPSTPILTPLDPRSPSTNIARTPLELILGTKTNLEDSTEIAEDGEVMVQNVILNVDPRSPTVEFNRTPIIVSTIVKEKPLKLTNKNFDNVRKSTIQTTPTGATRTGNVKLPKLLGSSPIYLNPNAHKRRSLVGLLETNIDFTETNLDHIQKQQINECDESQKATLESTTPLSNETESPNFVTVEDTVDSPISEEISIGDEKVHSENEQTEEKKLEEAELQMTECANAIDTILEEKTVNITAHVKDFDKKLTNLIYQDESEDEDNKLGLRLAKTKENNRTPLGVRNSNEEAKKPASRLKVSDRPRKIEISKIPIFKDGTQGKKMGVQCENTPPKKVDDKKFKTRISHWDGDKTLII